VWRIGHCVIDVFYVVEVVHLGEIHAELAFKTQPSLVLCFSSRILLVETPNGG
jgi:hypothetical protein